MRLLSLTFLLISGVFLTSCRAREVRIMPLGASYTAGLAVTSTGEHVYDGGYRRYLETRLEGFFDPSGLNFDFVGSQEDAVDVQIQRKHHEGHPGWRIRDIDQHAAEWVKTYDPDAVLLLVGTNDVLKNDDLGAAPDRLDQLVGHLLTAHHVKWVFVSSIIALADPALNAEVETYNAGIEQKVLERQSQGQPVVWVDMYRDAGVSTQELGDGIHPDDPGYEKMANVWYRAIIRTMSSGSLF